MPIHQVGVQLLVNYLGGDTVAGGKMKELGASYWQTPNTGADNSSGFSARGGGGRLFFGSFSEIGFSGSWWSASSYDAMYSKSRFVFYDNAHINRHFDDKYYGHSIRCIYDFSTQINDNSIDKNIQIYPNPAIDIIHINFVESPASWAVNLQIYNIIGECVLQNELSNKTNEIDISSLSKGIYVIQIKTSDKTIQRKLIKN